MVHLQRKENMIFVIKLRIVITTIYREEENLFIIKLSQIVN